MNTHDLKVYSKMYSPPFLPNLNLVSTDVATVKNVTSHAKKTLLIILIKQKDRKNVISCNTFLLQCQCGIYFKKEQELLKLESPNTDLQYVIMTYQAQW